MVFVEGHQRHARMMLGINFNVEFGLKSMHASIMIMSKFIIDF